MNVSEHVAYKIATLWVTPLYQETLQSQQIASIDTTFSHL